MKLLTKESFRMVAALLIVGSIAAAPLLASSHAEAPMTSMDRYADNTDVYAFRSTENGRGGYVTLIANFVPFQDPSGGPQFYRFDDTVLYEIHIDNTGDGVADVSYQFRFDTQVINGATALGHTALNEDGVVRNLMDPDYNMPQTYTVFRVEGNRPPQRLAVLRRTPPANVGPRVTPNYEANLGSQAVYQLKDGRVFAGQRDEGFFIDVGAVFDGLGFRSIGATGGVDTLRGFNVNTIALEIPIGNLTRSGSVPTDPQAPDAVIGIWSTASRQTSRVLNPNPGRVINSGPFRQVSRLGNPLVNEVIIPLDRKDGFNMSDPTMDSLAAPFVLDPELPRLIQTIFGLYGPLGGPPIPIDIPTAPRTDLAQIFALGIPAGAIPTAPNFTTVIQGTDGPHEYLRLNVAIPPSANPQRLGLLAGDPAGFPNGRRPLDDVVDIELRAVLGGTPLTSTFNHPPNNSVGDGVAANFEGFLNRFPYLQTPNPGNTPRMTNFPADQTRPEGEKAPLPVVDENGLLVNRFAGR